MPDVTPKAISPNPFPRMANGCFTERTFHRKDILPKDISPNRHFTERTVYRIYFFVDKLWLYPISLWLLWKRIEQAKKLWKLFDAIGMDKIYRIHSFSVSSISKMTYEDIQYNMSVDYSIKIESSACALPKMVYQVMKKIPNCHILMKW